MPLPEDIDGLLPADLRRTVAAQRDEENVQAARLRLSDADRQALD